MTDSADSNELSITVAKAISDSMSESFELPSSEIIYKFDKVEVSLLQKKHSDAEALEIMRRIAEAKISIIFNKVDTSSAFENAWKDIESLGYSTAEREATMLFYRAQFLMRNNLGRDLVANAIERLGIIANNFKNERSERLADHFEKVHKNLLIEMNAKYS